MPLILDRRPAFAGQACIAMVNGFHGGGTDIGTLRLKVSAASGAALRAHLVQAAVQLGLEGAWRTRTLDELARSRAPAILDWGEDRFVVLDAVTRGTVTIQDPLHGLRRLTRAEAEARFRGLALELAPAARLVETRRAGRRWLLEIIRGGEGFRRRAVKAVLLSCLLQIFVLASPLYISLSLDKAVPAHDERLLMALAFAFAAVALVRAVTEWLRSQVLIAMAQAIHEQIVGKLFRHLIRLPMKWFEERPIGEVSGRFDSSTELKELFAQELIAALVDGLMAVLTLVMMFLYSPLLTCIALVTFVALGWHRARAAPVLTSREEEMWQSVTTARSHFMETVRAIQAIKLMGQEPKRDALWTIRFQGTLGKTFALQRTKARHTVIENVAGALENTITIFLGARMVMLDQLTIGMFLAFMIYRISFTSASVRLLHASTRYRMLDVHLERLSDIFLHRRETADGSGHPELAGKIELRDVNFAYNDADRPVLEDVNLTVGAGEFIAITGPSGGGKTTLLKLMVTLLEPRSGRILFDGAPCEEIGLHAIRSQMGVVMQDDALVSGTLADNISFFDEHRDIEWIHHCARLAGLDAEIIGKPLGYDTEVSDLGTALSGGQRQRLLLARALYRRPRILLLDEGTSHLDLETERQVNLAISKLGITRIMIAHRPDTIAAADRVYQLSGGRLRELSREEPSAVLY